MGEGRYKLIGSQYPIILDTIKVYNESMDDKDGFMVGVDYATGEPIEHDRFYTLDDLVDLLNYYDNCLNKGNHEFVVSVDYLFPQLQSKITSMLSNLSMYESDSFAIQFVDANYLNEEFEKFVIKVKVSRTDASGFSEPAPDDLMKNKDDYTMMLVFTKLQEIYNRLPNPTEEDKILFSAIRAELLSL